MRKKEPSVLAITCNYGSRAISKKCARNTEAKETRRVRRRASKPRATRNYLHGTSSYIDMYVNAQPTSRESDFPFRRGEQMRALLQFSDTCNGYASLFSLFPDPLGR